MTLRKVKIVSKLKSKTKKIKHGTNKQICCVTPVKFFAQFSECTDTCCYSSVVNLYKYQKYTKHRSIQVKSKYCMSKTNKNTRRHFERNVLQFFTKNYDILVSYYVIGNCLCFYMNIFGMNEVKTSTGQIVRKCVFDSRF